MQPFRQITSNLKFLALILAASLIGFLNVSLATAADTETVVFAKGTDGYFAYRIPSLLVSPQGTLLSFCEGRKTTFSDDGDNDLVLRRSTDGGQTWGKLQLVHEEGGDAVVSIGNPCAVVDESTGTIWLTMNRKNGRVLITSSNDNGQTWAPVKDITSRTSESGWGWYALGPGVGIQLQQGPHKGRLVIPANHRTTPDRSGPSASHIIYSDDHGQSWHIGGTVGLHTNECQVAELADGTLLINARNHWARSGKKSELAGQRIIFPQQGRRRDLERGGIRRRADRARLPGQLDFAEGNLKQWRAAAGVQQPGVQEVSQRDDRAGERRRRPQLANAQAGLRWLRGLFLSGGAAGRPRGLAVRKGQLRVDCVCGDRREIAVRCVRRGSLTPP